MDLYGKAERLALYVLDTLCDGTNHRDILVMLGMVQWFVLSQSDKCLDLRLEDTLRDAKYLIDRVAFPTVES